MLAGVKLNPRLPCDLGSGSRGESGEGGRVNRVSGKDLRTDGAKQGKTGAAVAGVLLEDRERTTQPAVGRRESGRKRHTPATAEPL